jgi:hypothetical protein
VCTNAKLHVDARMGRAANRSNTSRQVSSLRCRRVLFASIAVASIAMPMSGIVESDHQCGKNADGLPRTSIRSTASTSCYRGTLPGKNHRGWLREHPGVDPRLLEVLSRASSLELFQLKSVIERMLADPKRIVQIRKDLHLGQTVRFMDWRDGQMRTGKILAMKDTQATIHEDGTRNSWSVPYAARRDLRPGR